MTYVHLFSTNGELNTLCNQVEASILIIVDNEGSRNAWP